MKIITAQTKRGIVLKGGIWDNASSGTAVVMISGICSNVFNNEMFETIGEFLNEKNITFICGQTSDAFSLLHYTDSNLKKQVVSGVVFDNFDYVYEDVDAYLQYAKQHGYKNIILAGHSLGSNKIIHYLSKSDESLIKNFIVSGPIDLMHFWDCIEEKDMYLKMAQDFVDKGRGKDILPFLFMGFSPMCADTLLGFFNAENLKNCPVISNKGETKSLNNIKINGAFIIGSKDNLTAGDAKGFIERINSHCKQSEKNKLVVVEDASHIFYGKDKELAQAMMDCLESFAAVSSV